jgi:hypothetical protein
MYLIVRKYRKVDGDRKLVIDSVNKTFLPMISKIDGFIDYYCFFADDGSLLSVSVFRDAKGAEESLSTAGKFVDQNLAKLLPDKPEVMSGEVFAHRRFEQKKAA